jgi:hypothetical protein
MGLFDRIRARASRRSSSPPPNPITKLEQTIATWDREQARLALAVFSATIFNDQAPLVSLLGKGANVETATRRLTVGHMRSLYSIMTEIFPDAAEDKNEHD